MTTRAKRPARTQSPSPDPLDIEDPTLLSIGTSILQGVAVRGLAKRDRDAANRALLKKMFSQYEEDVGPAQAITQAPPQEKLFIRIHLNKPKKQAEGAMGPTNGGRAAGMDRVEENALSQEKSLIVKIKIPPGDLAVLRELYPGNPPTLLYRTSNNKLTQTVESAPPAVGGMISRRKEPSGTLPKTTTLPSCNPKTQPEQGIIPNKPTPPPNIDRAEPLSDTLRAHYHLPLNRKTPEYDPATFPPSKRTRPRKNASVARTGVTNPQQPPAPPSLPTSRQEDTHATLHPSQIPTAQNGPMAIPPAGPFPSLAPTYPTAVTPEAAIPLTPEQYLELYNQVTQSRPAPLDIPFLNSFSSDANSLHTPTISMYRGNLGSQTVPHASPYPVIKGNPSQTPALQTPQSQPPPIPQTPQPTSPPQLLPPSPAPSPKKPTPKKPKPTPKPTPNPPTPRKLLRPRTCKGKFRSTRRSSSGSDTIPYRPDPIKPHSKTPAAQNTRRSSPPSLPPLRSASPTDPRFAPAAYLPAFPALRTAEVRRLFGQGVQLAVGNIWEEYFWGVGGEREKGMYDSRTEVLRGFGQEVSDSDEESESDDGSSDMEKEGEGEEEEEEEGKKGDAATTILARSDQDHDDDEDVDTPLTLLSTIRHLRAEMPDLGDNKGRGLARDFRTHIMAGNRWVYDAVEAVKGKYPGLCAEEAVRLVREGWARQERVWRVEDWRKGKGRGRGRGARTRRMVEEDEDEEEGGTETETEEEGEEDDDGEWSDS